MHNRGGNMDLIRIGDKLISVPKLEAVLKEILKLRKQGLSQIDVARRLDIDRTFISRLESLGEIRRGQTIGLIGFPIKNVEEIESLAFQEGIDDILLMNDKQRWDFVYKRSGIELLNEVMNLIYKFRQYDVVIILGSDKRIRLFGAILDNEVVPIEIGKSPMREDVHIDPKYLKEIIKKVKRG